MAITPIRNLGRSGIITDIPDYDLAPEQFTNGNNVRFEDGQVKSFPGNSTFFTPTVTPYYVVPYTDGTVFYWLYMGLTKGYLYNGTTDPNVTRASGDYTGAATNRWNGGVLGGVPIVNNGVDAPQYYNGTLLTDMIWDGATTWTTQGVVAKVVRPHKYHAVALNITESGTNYPFRVLWSNPTEGGTMPDSWDYSDATNDAGFVDLEDTQGYVIDFLPMRDFAIVYKEDAAYRMSYVPGGSIFSFQRILKVPGMLAQGCAVEVKGRHIVLGPGDLYWTDGQQWESLADDRVKRTLFNDIESDAKDSCFLQHVPSKEEVWICYPTSGETQPNKALIWSYRDETFTWRDLPQNTSAMALGSIASSALTYDGLGSITYDQWVGTYSERDYSASEYHLISASTDFQKYEDGYQFNSVNPICYVEKTGINLGELGTFQTITKLFPRMEYTGDSVDFYVGQQYQPSDAVTWSGPYTFTPGNDRQVDCLVTGNYHSFRVITEGNVRWGLSAIDIEHEEEGER